MGLPSDTLRHQLEFVEHKGCVCSGGWRPRAYLRQKRAIDKIVHRNKALESPFALCRPKQPPRGRQFCRGSAGAGIRSRPVPSARAVSSGRRRELNALSRQTLLIPHACASRPEKSLIYNHVGLCCAPRRLQRSLASHH